MVDLRVVVAAASLVVAGASEARAQEGFALNQFEPGLPGDAFISVPSPWIGGHLTPGAMVAFDYSQDPLSLNVQDEQVAIVSSLAFVRGAASLALWDRLLVAAEMPFAVHQAGDNPTIDGVTVQSPSTAQPGDLRLALRGRLYGERDAPFQLALATSARVPTGTRDSYVAEGSLSVYPHAVVGGRIGPIVWSANGGGTLRTSGYPHAINFGGAVAYAYANGVGFQIGPEVFGSYLTSDARLLDIGTAALVSDKRVSTEGLLSAKFRFLDAFVVGAAVGTGLAAAPGTPRLRMVTTFTWAPSGDAKREGDHVPESDSVPQSQLTAGTSEPPVAAPPRSPADRDGDGIADDDDRCPDTVGVTSDIADYHGCPGDEDGDDIGDDVDACPNVPGFINEDASRHGCPDEEVAPAVAQAPKLKPVELARIDSDERIDLGAKLLFDHNHQVHSRSAPTLRKLLWTLERHPEYALIEVAGHTDNRGPESFNLLLSLRRAQAVRSWLMNHGIPSERLRVAGYGSGQPIASNRDRFGRLRNSRIEFVIKERTHQ